MHKTADKSVFDEHKSPTVTIGDLISCSKNSFGLVDSINIRYDRETAMVISNSGQYLGSGAFNVGGQVYKITGDTMAYYAGVIPAGVTLDTVISDGSESTQFKELLNYYKISDYKYIIFDSSLDRSNSHLIEASLGEVKTYVEDPENVTTFIATKNGTASGIFIIYK